MKITFYRSPFCPRCYLTRKVLQEIIYNNKEIELEEIDVIAHPLRTWRDGIRIFPALKIGKRTLSGIFLGRKILQAFINES